MTEFKVGDRVRLNEKCQFIGGVFGYSAGSVGTITEDSYQSSLQIEMQYPINGYDTLYCFSHELDLVDNFPPTTITHEGYTYTRGERVRPEWLKDGAWVVNVGTGDLRQVKEVSPGVFDLTTGTIILIRYFDHIRDQYRPHKPSDYKWGDWAMYEGKKVFVMCEPDSDGHIAISGTGMNNALSNWKFVRPHNLTPTHAP